MAGVSETFTFAHMFAQQKHLAVDGEDIKNLAEVANAIPGQKYAYGYNEHMGDPNPMFNMSTKPSTINDTRWWSELDALPWHYTPESAKVKPKW